MLGKSVWAAQGKIPEQMIPTPVARDYKDGASVQNVPIKGHLGRWAVHHPTALWPTPRAEGFDAGGHRGNADSLPSAVKLWPTPQAQLAKHGHPSPAQMNRVASLDTEVFKRGTEKVQAMKLHSAWVSRMMGYPDGWLDLD